MLLGYSLAEMEYSYIRRPTNLFLKQWNDDFKEKRYTLCPVPGCGVMFHRAIDIETHYTKCTGKSSSLTVICSHCYGLLQAEHIELHDAVMHNRRVKLIERNSSLHCNEIKFPAGHSSPDSTRDDAFLDIAFINSANIVQDHTNPKTSADQSSIMNIPRMIFSTDRKYSPEQCAKYARNESSIEAQQGMSEIMSNIKVNKCLSGTKSTFCPIKNLSKGNNELLENVQFRSPSVSSDISLVDKYLPDYKSKSRSYVCNASHKRSRSAILCRSDVSMPDDLFNTHNHTYVTHNLNTVSTNNFASFQRGDTAHWRENENLGGKHYVPKVMQTNNCNEMRSSVSPSRSAYESDENGEDCLDAESEHFSEENSCHLRSLDHGRYMERPSTSQPFFISLGKIESKDSDAVYKKRKELAEMAEKLQRAEHAVQLQEEVAMEKIWQALKVQQTALNEREKQLKARECIAQKKLNEATKLLEETKRLNSMPSQPIHESLMLVAPHRKVERPSSTQRRKPRKLNYLQELGELIPTIEPEKILRTYSRTSRKQSDNQSSRLTIGSISDLKHTLKNDHDTITIIQQPKLSRSNTLVPSLKKLRSIDSSLTPASVDVTMDWPLQVQKEACSPHSGSSDTSVSLLDKVEKLTSRLLFTDQKIRADNTLKYKYNDIPDSKELTKTFIEQIPCTVDNFPEEWQEKCQSSSMKNAIDLNLSSCSYSQLGQDFTNKSLQSHLTENTLSSSQPKILIHNKGLLIPEAKFSYKLSKANETMEFTEAVKQSLNEDSVIFLEPLISNAKCSPNATIRHPVYDDGIAAPANHLPRNNPINYTTDFHLNDVDRLNCDIKPTVEVDNDTVNEVVEFKEDVEEFIDMYDDDVECVDISEGAESESDIMVDVAKEPSEASKWVDNSDALVAYNDNDSSGKHPKNVLTIDDCRSSEVEEAKDNSDAVAATPFVVEVTDINTTIFPQVSPPSLDGKGNTLKSKGGRTLKLKDWWPGVVRNIKPSLKKGSFASSFEAKADAITEPLSCRRTELKKKAAYSQVNLKTKENKPYTEAISESNNNSELNECDSISFVCGRCNVSFTNSEELNIHIYKEHNGLARPKGSSQKFTFYEASKLISRAYIEMRPYYAERKLLQTMTCERCKKIFKSFGGYKYHFENVCGDESVKKVKHQDNCVNEEKEGSSNKTNKLQREAAKHCREHLKALMEADLSSDSPKDDDEEIDSSIKKLFTCTVNALSERERNNLINKFRDKLREDKTAPCINEGCEVHFTDCKKLRLHLRVCSKSNKGFKCNICYFAASTAVVMANHVISQHSSYLTDSEYDESSGDEYPLSKRRKCWKGNKQPIMEFMSAVQMTREFRKENYSERLFPTFVCNKSNWRDSVCKNDNYYLPTCRISPQFKHFCSNSGNEPQSWQKMNIFNGVNLRQSKIIFTGGPVQSAAWCPLPEMSNGIQFIALCSQGDPNQTYPFSQIVKHKGLIQLWNCLGLENDSIPSLSFCIAHDYGLGWNMEWCPSGIYENETSQRSCYRRLGLLGASFSDGSVRIFIIPNPTEFEHESQIYERKADLSLLLYGYDEMNVQCTNFNWCPSKGHSQIVGSFTNGLVCIWNLTGKVQVLHDSDNFGNGILYPIISIKAHQGLCSTVSFCPSTHGRNIVTGGSDRIVRFWDLDQPEQPITVIKKGVVTCSSWLPHWAGAFIAYDDAFCYEKTYTSYRDNGFFGSAHRNVLPCNACVSNISASDWLNALAQVDEAGEVVITFQQSLLCEGQSEKLLCKKRIPLFSIKLENLETGKMVSLKEEYSSTTADSEKKSVTLSPTTSFALDEIRPEKLTNFPGTYSSTMKEFGIVFCDEDLVGFKSGKSIPSKQYSHLMDPGPLTIYPFMGASSISWNNNFGVHRWIFVGLKSGLGRFIQIKFDEDR